MYIATIVRARLIEHLVQLFYLKIRGGDAVHVVFFNFIWVFRIVNVDLGPLNLAYLHSTHPVELFVHSSV